MLEPYEKELLRPKCYLCKEHIQDETMYVTADEKNICPSCMERKKRFLWEEDNGDPVTVTCSECGAIVGLYYELTIYAEIDGRIICERCISEMTEESE